MIEWRLIYKYGKQLAEARYSKEEWNGWYFPVFDEPKKHYKWEESLKLYRRNVSI